MTELEKIIWFAGLFEGEGTFCFCKNVGRQLSIQMTDKDIIDRLQTFFGGKVYNIKKRKEHHKDSWVWVLGSKDSIKIVEDIIPYLGLRRKKRALEYITSFKGIEKYNRERKEERLLKAKKVKELYTKGLKHKEIANKLGIERSTVTKLLKLINTSSCSSAELERLATNKKVAGSNPAMSTKF